MLSALTFIFENWWWIAPLVLALLGGLKLAAKRTPWVWDDRIVTLLIGLVKMTKGAVFKRVLKSLILMLTMFKRNNVE